MPEKSLFKIILITGVLTALVFAGNFYYQNLRGAWPSVKPVAPRQEAPAGGQNTTGIPLIIPEGFSVSIFAENLPGARVMLFDSFGNIWVSQTSEGVVSLIEVRDGKATRQDPLFQNLRKPHGLALDPDNPFVLYIAEEHGISKANIYSEGGLEKIADLPAGAGHSTRTIGFGPDKRLYVSIGSSCNVCNEGDSRRAKIFSMKKDGSDFREYARGLRNAVFFAWHPATNEMWASEMGLDLLGDDIPPDEINIVEEGKNYGWPICYGKNIHDSDFDKNTYIRNPCMEPFETPSLIDVPAHSAPLGLAFVNNKNWPADYEDDLLVAHHGSWNRTEPTGYKIVRMKLTKTGAYEGNEDFIAGWLSGGDVYGRPVDLVFGPDGGLYVSDDKAGRIYLVRPY